MGQHKAGRNINYGKKKINKKAKAAKLRELHKKNLLFAQQIMTEILDEVSKNTHAAKEANSIVMEIVDAAIFQCSSEETKKETVPSQPVSGCFSGNLEGHIADEDNANDEYDFTWGSLEEYERINEYPLEIEKVKEEIVAPGYRIVNIQYLMSQSVRLQHTHSKRCTGGILQLNGEKRKGLVSTLIYKCNVCDREEYIYTEDPKKEMINRAAVWGTLATGSIFEHTSELFSILDIPFMSRNMFFEVQRKLGSVWRDSLWDVMEKAGQEEYQHAMNSGNIDKNGIGRITVIVDGGWSKRSFGHTYNALSGVAVIIGKVTGKLLYLGVKNKFCSICCRAETKGEPVKEHTCFKNWTKSSGSMEAAIIADGFNESISMHQLRYTKFIGDDDSSVYSEIKKKVTYGAEVEKSECTNHAIKNYTKTLMKIKNDTKNVSLQARKMLSKEDHVNKLAKAAQNAIYANAHGDRIQLREDIRNSVKHVFNNHQDCRQYVCEKAGDTSENQMPELIKSGAHHHIYAALNMLLIKSHLLIDNETSNRAELYMSLLARFNMGKRLNLIQRDSYQLRCYLTGLKYNDGPLWQKKTWKDTFKRSPGKYLKTFMEKKEKLAISRKRRDETNGRPRSAKRLKLEMKPKSDEDDAIGYGPDIAEVYLDDEALQTEVLHKMQELMVTPEERDRIAANTTQQFASELYKEERRFRLTASKFGAVVKRRSTTSCDSLVKEILNTDGNLYTPAIQYGKINESVAKLKFTEITKKSVRDSGLYIDLNHGYLAASPDGIISDTELVEVKCLHKVAMSQKSLIEAVRDKDVQCLELVDNKISLKKNHDYYYQVQGQLAIAQREICYFIVYSGDNNDLEIIEITKDMALWENVMLPKLIKFYRDYVAVERVLERRKKKLKCRDPPYILEAQAKKKCK